MRYIFFLSFFLFSGNLLYGSLKLKNSVLVFENEVMVNKLSFQNGQISPLSIFSKRLNRELIDQNNHLPWFEFVVNHTMLTSNDPIWKYRSHEIRILNNGGKEIKIIVEAIKKVKGLKLEIYRQYFPESTLIRERIRLKSDKHSYSLNKINGNIHFIFPRYAVESLSQKVSLEEIRIATFDDEILDSFHSENQNT